MAITAACRALYIHSHELVSTPVSHYSVWGVTMLQVFIISLYLSMMTDVYITHACIQAGHAIDQGDKICTFQHGLLYVMYCCTCI